MPTTADPMTIGLDTIHFHLKRAVELLKELQEEQHGMPETHILENLTIFLAETESTSERLGQLIGEVKGEAA